MEVEGSGLPRPSPARGGGGDIDEECDHDSHDRPERPLSAKPAKHCGIPEERRRKEYETEDGPEQGRKEPAEPVREEPQEGNHESRHCERDHDEETRHVRSPPGAGWAVAAASVEYLSLIHISEPT